jgi:hypothetical protein
MRSEEAQLDGKIRTSLRTFLGTIAEDGCYQTGGFRNREGEMGSLTSREVQLCSCGQEAGARTRVQAEPAAGGSCL